MRGISVFAPIAHSHPIADYMDERYRMDFDLWMRIDLPLLRCASEVHVLMLEGWQESRGVTRERQEAAVLKIPIQYVAP